MTTIRRGPTPPGPVTELFDRLDQLHLEAGRPSMREIATRVGRGRISSSTVHNVFRNSRVPRWIFLEDIVKTLHGDTAAFLDPVAGRLAGGKQGSRGGARDQPARRPAHSPEPSAVCRHRSYSGSGRPRSRPAIRKFTGREAELEALSTNLLRRAGRALRCRSSPAWAGWARPR